MSARCEQAAYSSWIAMKQRVLNTKHINYRHYGGRGISICDRWINSFDNFFADMGYRPVAMSLERKDVNGNYEPGNCIWASAKQQGRNRRNNKIIAIGNEQITASEISERCGLGYSTIRYREKRGYTADMIVSGSRFPTGATIPRRGEDLPTSKLTDRQVVEIRRLGCGGESHRSIAVKFGVGHSTIGSILRHKAWTHVSEGIHE